MVFRIILLTCALLAPAAAVRASVVFNDPFTEGPNSDTNLNDNLGRQSGSAAPSSYTITNPNDPTGSSNATVDGNLEMSVGVLNGSVGGDNEVFASPSTNFNQTGQIQMTFGMDPSVHSTSTTNWLAFAFGMTSSSQGQFINSTDGIGLLIRDNGGVYVFDGSTGVSDVSLEDPNNGNGGTDLTRSREGLDTVQIIISAIGADPQTVKILINGVPVEFGDGADDTTTYTRAAGFTSDYTQFESLAIDGYFTNFTVQTVPEPASLALVGLSAFRLLRRRRGRP
jgi:hypothetical protein